jgi:hypothetical protein
MGLGTIGGFKLFVEDRADLGYDTLYQTLQGIIGKSYQTPGLAGVFSTFTVNVPQVDADIDRVKAKQQGVPLQNLFETMRIYLGLTVAAFCSWFCLGDADAQSLRIPWSGYGQDAQHNVISPAPSQPLNHILWQTPVDLNPVYSGTTLLIHYGSPLITRSNTVIVPVKVGTNDGFRVEGRTGTNGVLKWTQTTDYRLPPHNWVPSFSPTLTPKNRLYFPGGGGTVYFRDSPDATSGATGRVASCRSRAAISRERAARLTPESFPFNWL